MDAIVLEMFADHRFLIDRAALALLATTILASWQRGRRRRGRLSRDGVPGTTAAAADGSWRASDADPPPTAATLALIAGAAGPRTRSAWRQRTRWRGAGTRLERRNGVGRGRSGRADAGAESPASARMRV